MPGSEALRMRDQLHVVIVAIIVLSILPGVIELIRARRGSS